MEGRRQRGVRRLAGEFDTEIGPPREGGRLGLTCLVAVFPLDGLWNAEDLLHSRVVHKVPNIGEIITKGLLHALLKFKFKVFFASESEDENHQRSRGV